MSRVLSSREKVLAALVGGAVLLVVNLFLFTYLFGNYQRLQAGRVSKARQLQSLQAQLSTVPLWEQRDQWLKASQPKLEMDATAAGNQLLEQVKVAARQEGVTVEQPVINAVEPRPYCMAITVNLEAKSTWKALVGLLSNLQTPEAFLVLESANLRVDGTDQTQMRGRFRVAKWYAPK